MGKKSSRRVSGNPAKAALQRAERLRAEQLRIQDAQHTAAINHMLRSVPEPAEEDWDRLEQQLLQDHPTCADCGAPMEIEPDSGEYGGDDEGTMIISTWAHCTAWQEAEDAGEEPPPHPKTDGMVEGELILRPRA